MEHFLKVSGDYTRWNVYRKAVIISDVTELFITRALPRGIRTIDQMRQAARSCKQNIVEGITDGTVSTEMCLKLLGVARGSARELLEDYGDFLRQNRLQIWSMMDPRTRQTRDICRLDNDSFRFVESCRLRSNETVANIMITQLKQMDAMLAGCLKKIEEGFLEKGGVREAMTAARKKKRGF
ncbi:MAG: four helix bundle suffix domain-containing protein [Duncaniella sp.]|nr:four helix bundle suffix domain-containing protein [Duncaniella sp.]